MQAIDYSKLRLTAGQFGGQTVTTNSIPRDINNYDGLWYYSLSPDYRGIIEDERSGLGDERPQLGGIAVELDGATQSLEFDHGNSGTLSATYYDVSSGSWENVSLSYTSDKYTISAAGIYHNLKLWTSPPTQEEIEATEYDTIPANLWGWYKCDDNSQSILRDCSGNGRDGDIVGGVDYYLGDDVLYSWLDSVGYTSNSGEYIPRDENDILNDVDGNSLEYSGQAPRKAKLVDACCLKLNGVNQRIDLPSNYTDIFEGKAAVTLCCLFRLDDSSKWNSILGFGIATNNVAFLVRIENNQVVVMGRSVSSDTAQDSTAGSIQNDTWYELVVIQNCTTKKQKIYVNKVLEADNTKTFGQNVFTNFVTPNSRIGMSPAINAARYFGGDIAYLAVYDKELSAEQIQEARFFDYEPIMYLTGSEVGGPFIWDLSKTDNTSYQVVNPGDNRGNQDVFHWNAYRGFSDPKVSNSPEILENSDFSEGLSGYTFGVHTTSEGYAEVLNNNVILNIDSGTHVGIRPDSSVSFESSKKYLISIRAYPLSGSCRFVLSVRNTGTSPAGGSQLVFDSNNIDSVVEKYVVWEPGSNVSAFPWLRLQDGTGSYLIEEFSIRETDFDRADNIVPCSVIEGIDAQGNPINVLPQTGFINSESRIDFTESDNLVWASDYNLPGSSGIDAYAFGGATWDVKISRDLPTVKNAISLKTRKQPAEAALLFDTNNTTQGSSLDNQLVLPLTSTGLYDFVVDWGDGQIDYINHFKSLKRLHTYTTPGQYTVTIKGKFRGWKFDNLGDRLKLLEIVNLGALNLGEAGNFWGCSNLIDISDDFVFVNSDISNIFRDCSSFTGVKLLNSNFDRVNNFTNMLRGTAFNQDLSSFKLRPSINLNGMLDFSSMSSENYSRTLIGWANSNPPFNILFSAADVNLNDTAYGGSPFSNAVDAKEHLLSKGWTITDLGVL